MLSASIIIAALAATASASSSACLTPKGVHPGYNFGKERSLIKVIDAEGPDGQSYHLTHGKGDVFWYDVPDNMLLVQATNKDKQPRTIHIGVFATEAAAKSGRPLSIATAPLPPAKHGDKVDAAPCISPAPANRFYAISIM